MLTYSLNKVVMVLTTVALARLLAPEDFGLVALATVSIGALALLRELGLGGVLVVHQDLDRRSQGTVFTMILATSALTAVVIAAIAPLVAMLLDEPRLTSILAVMSVTAFLGGFNTFYDTLLQRELEFRRRFVGSVVGTAVYAGTSLGLAVVGFGVWSIVVGIVASMTAWSFVLLVLSPYRVRPAYDRRVARETLGAGKGFLLQSAVSYVQQSVDFFAIGRFLGAARLGYYTLAYRVAELPYLSIADPIAKVTFPGFARMRYRGEDVTPMFLSTLKMVALVTCPLGVLASGAADPLVRTVFGEKWLPAVGPLVALGIWSTLRSIQGTIGWYLNSIGHAWVMGWVGGLLTIPIVVTVCLAAVFGGITTVAWVMVGNAAISLAALVVLTSRRAGVPIASQWVTVRGVALACPLTWLATWGVASATSGQQPVVALFLSSVAGVATYVAAVSIFEPGLIVQAARVAARTVGQRPAAAVDPG